MNRNIAQHAADCPLPGAPWKGKLIQDMLAMVARTKIWTFWIGDKANTPVMRSNSVVLSNSGPMFFVFSLQGAVCSLERPKQWTSIMMSGEWFCLSLSLLQIIILDSVSVILPMSFSSGSRSGGVWYSSGGFFMSPVFLCWCLPTWCPYSFLLTELISLEINLWFIAKQGITWFVALRECSLWVTYSALVSAVSITDTAV